MPLPNWDISLQDAAAPYIVRWATEYDIPLEIAFALVAMESGFKPTAYRYEAHIDDASYGLAQILTRTARSVGYLGEPAGLFDPDTGLRYGLKYLRQMFDRFKNWDVAISAYNEGPGSAAIGNPRYVQGVKDRAAYFARTWDMGTDPVYPWELPPADDPPVSYLPVLDSKTIAVAGLGALVLLWAAAQRPSSRRA